MPYSRFYLTDLQVHTPADPHQRYGNWAGKDPNPAFAKKFIEHCVARDLRVFAVTDHNRVDWYPVLREEGDKHGVFVFPGVEVSINRCHLLMVWDRTEEGFSLAEQFLATCWAQALRQNAAAVTALGVAPAVATKLIERFDSKKLREFEELATPDRISAEVNLGTPGAETWKPVTGVSPGQRATALLALVLLSSDEPLIIDQPEDDLDNQHIYEDIVRVLADVCQNRQVIVATHNANIPVLGDAELLVALDADAQRSRVEALGGFEDAAVASYARRVLEGGEDAFRARQRRYSSAHAPE
jgi:hypothetical protein